MSRYKLWVPCLLALAVTGCGSTQTKDPDEGEVSAPPELVLLKEDELYTGIPDEQLTIKDDDVKFAPDTDADPELIARWVTERRNVISWCLDPSTQTIQAPNEFGVATIRYKKVFPGTKRTETRLDQAITIGKKVVDKVPDATRERYRFAECLFSRGSFEFWQMDALEQEIYGLRLKDRDDRTANDKQKLLAEHGKRMVAYQTLALQNFKSYQSSYPMDKRPLDWIWKCYFQLGNFRDAVSTLDTLLQTDVLDDRARKAYLEIRGSIVTYLQERELDPKAPKPGSRERPVKLDSVAGPG